MLPARPFVAAALGLAACTGAKGPNTVVPPDDTGTPVASSALVFTGDRPRNLLMVSIDTVRRQDVGRYRGDDTTPFLDSLAEGGVTLDAHEACSSWTLPATVCALTGRDAQDFGVVPHIEGTDVAPAITVDMPSLPRWLGEQGFTTSLVSTNGYVSQESFPDYQTMVLEEGLPAPEVAREVIEATEADGFGDAPWFLHVHFLDPHSPYDAPESYLTELEGRPELEWDLRTQAGARELAAAWETLDAETQAEVLVQLDILYRAQLSYIDDELSILFAELGTRGLLDDTLVVFWSDHGEQLFEHGFLGHGGTLYAETTNAIAFFQAPGLTPLSWTGVTTHIDLVPTVLDALGVQAPVELPGSVVGTAPEGRPVFGTVWPHGKAPRQSVRIDSDRLVYGWGGQKELFDLDTDPGELTDVYDRNDPRVETLWDALLPEVEEVAPLIDGYEPVSPGP